MDTVYFRDRDGRFILINQAMAEREGLATPELATGKQPSQCCPCMIETLEQDQVVVMERNIPIINHMERFNTPDGRAEWLFSTKLPLRDHQGHLVGMFSVARDITEQKRAQDTVQQELERRDEFIAVLHGDITPGDKSALPGWNHPVGKDSEDNRRLLSALAPTPRLPGAYGGERRAARRA